MDISRNEKFAVERFDGSLKMMPTLRTIVIACVDPRVDPADLLGLEPGEAAVIRNVGGRVTPATVDELVLLRGVSQAAGGDFSAAWELVVLQHTDCGITRLSDDDGQLTRYLGAEAAHLHVMDPRAAVVLDVAALRADARLNGARVSGLVYDVATGRVQPVDD